jgi:hypothetical protein
MANKKLIKEKKAIEMQMLVYLIIAVLVLVIGVISYFYLKNSGTGLLAQIKNIFRGFG